MPTLLFCHHKSSWIIFWYLIFSIVEATSFWFRYLNSYTWIENYWKFYFILFWKRNWIRIGYNNIVLWSTCKTTSDQKHWYPWSKYLGYCIEVNSNNCLKKKKFSLRLGSKTRNLKLPYQFLFFFNNIKKFNLFFTLYSQYVKLYTIHY